jgi:hypothetical protein
MIALLLAKAGRDQLSTIIDLWKLPASEESLASPAFEILHNPEQSIPEAIE